jgi:hypothetical protein
MLNRTSKTISSLSKGVVTDYALYILIGVCFYLSIFTFVSVFFDLANVILITSIAVLLSLNNYIIAEKQN